MTLLRIIVWLAAGSVFILCTYAAVSWQLAGQDKSLNPFALYFFAKGIFCSLSLVLSERVVAILSRLARYSTPPEDLEE